MFMITLVLMQAAADLRLAEALHLQPAAAGDRVLQGEAHEPIESVAESAYFNLLPPGIVELELVETATMIPGGCSRHRWIAQCYQVPDSTREAAELRGTSRTTEVALAQGAACPDGQYTFLNPNLVPQAAFAALHHLNRLRASDAKVRFSCSDTTGSRLCTSRRSISSELTRLKPWALQHDGEAIVMWLGEPGQVVTEVRFDPAVPTRATVNRRIPAPA